MIPVSQVVVDADTEARVVSVLRSGALVQGAMVEEFEAGFAKVAGCRHAVAVSSGTTALVAALQALKVGAGDEVVIPAFTFVATLNAVLAVGATAVVVDVTLDYTVDPAALADAVTGRTVAVMPVHLYGLPADMGAIDATARRHGLAIVEDAAQAHGAEVAEQRVGSFGVGCFSFYATKNLSTGEGGMVTTDDGDLARRLRLLRNQGMERRYEYEISGFNYRMTDLQAALGIGQLAGLKAMNDRRRANAARYTDVLSRGRLEPPTVPEGRTHVFHQYTIRTGEGPEQRDALVDDLHSRGVGAAVYYPRAVHDYECFEGHPAIVAGDVPTARSFAERVVSLPVHQHLGDSDVERVAVAIGDAALVDRD